jgi:O-antigen/teichoic acid export membrane protein
MVAMREIPAASKFKIFKGLRELFFMALFLICWTMGTAGAVLAWCSSVVLGALVQFVWLAMKTGWKFELNRAIVKNSLAFGTKIHFAMLPMAAVLQMDIFVLNYFWGATEVGLYAVASSLIFKFAVLFVAFESATLTRIMGDTEALAKALVRKVIRHSVIAALLFALVVGVVGRPLIIILYGAVFEKAAAVLSILTIAMLAGAVNSFLNIYVVGQLKKPELSARVNWIGFALGLICYFTLVPRFGLMGAAVAAALIRIFILVLYFFFLKWYSMSAITETFILNMSDLMALRSRFMFLRESVVSKFANEER